MGARTVLISGAGIAGPTLAYWLLRGGFAPTLIEKAPSLRTGGYMLDFWGLGFQVAQQMGLIPRLKRDGYSVKEARLVNSRGQLQIRIGVEPLRSLLNDEFVSILRSDLAKATYECLEGRIETRFGDCIQSLDPDGDGMYVTFTHGSSQHFDIVVGADGMHSQVRRLVFGADAQFEKRLGYYVAAFIVDSYPHRDELTYVSYTLCGRHIARYALRDGRTTFFMVIECPDLNGPGPSELESQKAFLKEQFNGRGWECDEILPLLAECQDLYFDDVSQIQMPQWSQGRITLIGDAAHCPSLLAGAVGN